MPRGVFSCPDCDRPIRFHTGHLPFLLGAEETHDTQDTQRIITGTDGPPKLNRKKFDTWTAANLSEEQKEVLLDLVTQDSEIADMVTPYPVAENFAKSLLEACRATNAFDNRGRIVWLDAMSGSGMDSLAVKRVFGDRVVMDAMDIDPLKLSFMVKLLNAWQPNKALPDNPAFEALRSQRVMDVEHLIDPKGPHENIDVLYLDPPWPTETWNKKTPDPEKNVYTLGKRTLADFVHQILELYPKLSILAIKVSKSWEPGNEKPLRRALEANGKTWSLDVHNPVHCKDSTGKSIEYTKGKVRFLLIAKEPLNGGFQ